MPLPVFNFSFNLAGLKDGQHTVEIYADRTYENIGFSYTFPRKASQFTHLLHHQHLQLLQNQHTPWPFRTTLVIGSIIAVVAVVGLGLLVDLKKRSRDKNP